MDIEKFRRAMRPKKYLTRDFVVYRDSSKLGLGPFEKKFLKNFEPQSMSKTYTKD
jgi:hypothetical protein